MIWWLHQVLTNDAQLSSDLRCLLPGLLASRLASSDSSSTVHQEKLPHYMEKQEKANYKVHSGYFGVNKLEWSGVELGEFLRYHQKHWQKF